MEKKIVLLFSFLFFISLVSASSYIFFGDFSIPQEQNTCFNIPMPCDNCTYMNITILFPNGTPIIENQAMTNLSSLYYYNYSFCNTSTLGRYFFIVNYDEDGDIYADTNFFDVTPSGRETCCGREGLIYIGSLASMFLICIFFFVLSNSFKGDSSAVSGSKEADGNPAARFGSIALSFVIGIIAVLYSTMALSEIFWGFDKVLNNYSTFVYVLLTILFLLFIFILINITIKVIEAMRIKRGIKDYD